MHPVIACTLDKRLPTAFTPNQDTCDLSEVYKTTCKIVSGSVGIGNQTCTYLQFIGNKNRELCKKPP